MQDKKITLSAVKSEMRKKSSRESEKKKIPTGLLLVPSTLFF
jgi:hypothetical protein